MKTVYNNQLITKIFKLKLIKTKLYNKSFLNLKKNLKIIFKYNLKNKKILFFGLINKTNFFFKLLQLNKNCSFLPTNLWLNGILTNLHVFKHLCLLHKNKLFKFLFNFKFKKFDLIVLLNNVLNRELLKQNKIPFIFFYFTTNNNFYKFSCFKLIKNNNELVYFLIYNVINKFKNKL